MENVPGVQFPQNLAGQDPVFCIVDGIGRRVGTVW